MANQILNFRANTRLKDILGRGLILNDNVAIIVSDRADTKFEPARSQKNEIDYKFRALRWRL